MNKIRKALLRVLLGEKGYKFTLGMLDLALEEYSSAVTDPAMHVNPDDLKYCANLRRRILNVERIWWGKLRFPDFYKKTYWLTRYESE